MNRRSKIATAAFIIMLICTTVFMPSMYNSLVVRNGPCQDQWLHGSPHVRDTFGDRSRAQCASVVIAYYGRPGGLDMDEHSHVFTVKDGAAISAGNGSLFDSSIDIFLAPDVDVICVSGSDDFGTDTAEAIEEAVRTAGKILCVDYPADGKFNLSLPGENPDLAEYGPGIKLRAPGHTIGRGLPDTFSNSQSVHQTRRKVSKGSNATVIMEYEEDRTPALLIQPYGTGYVIHHTLGNPRAFYGQYEDTVYYNSIMYALTELRGATGPGLAVNVSATGGDGQIKISWEMPLDTGSLPITGYNIYWGESIFNITYLDTTTFMSYTHDELPNGQRCHYKIAPENFLGENRNAPFINATPMGMPSPPVDFWLRSGDGFIEATWGKPLLNGGVPITGYSLYRGPNVENLSIFCNLSEDIVHYNDTSVANGRSYFYRLTARNPLWEGTSTDTLGAVPSGLPGRPVNLSCREGDSTAYLTWDPPGDDGGSPMIGYVLYRGNGSVSMDFARFVWNRLNYTDLLGLRNGVTYYYSVSAVNENGEGAASVRNSTVPMRLPDVPENFTATEGDERIELSWKAPRDNGGSEVTGFMLYRTDEEGKKTVRELAGPVGNFTDRGLDNGCVYLYALSAVNRVGEGPRTTELNITPFGYPGPPRNLTADRKDDGTLIEWDPPARDGGSGVTKYHVYRALPDTEGVIIATVTEGTEYFDDSIPGPGTYIYCTMAVTGVGVSDRSNAVEVRIAWKPSAPLKFRVVAEEDDAVLRWDPPEQRGGLDIDGYYIYRKAGDGDPERLAWVNGTVYIDTELVPGFQYRYSVSAVNGRGEGPRTGERDVVLKVPGTRGVTKSPLVDNLRSPWFILSGAIFVIIIAAILAMVLGGRKKVEVKNWTVAESEKSNPRSTAPSRGGTLPSSPPPASMAPEYRGSAGYGQKGMADASITPHFFEHAVPDGNSFTEGSMELERDLPTDILERAGTMDYSKVALADGTGPNAGTSVQEPAGAPDGSEDPKGLALPPLHSSLHPSLHSSLPSPSPFPPPLPPDDHPSGKDVVSTEIPSPYTSGEGHITLSASAKGDYRNILDRIVEKTRKKKELEVPRIVMPEDVSDTVIRPARKDKSKRKRCGVCLDEITDSTDMIDCICGRCYHAACANTIGECPVCDNDLKEAMGRSLVSQGLVGRGDDELSFIWGR